MKRRGVLRTGRAVPCASRKTTRTESQKDIEVILKTKLCTIQEEPESLEDLGFPTHRRRRAIRKLNARAIVQTGQRFASRFSFVDWYTMFVANCVAKGGSFGVLILK